MKCSMARTPLDSRALIWSCTFQRLHRVHCLLSTPSDPKVTVSVQPAVAAALVLEQNRVTVSEEISYCQCQQLLQCTHNTPKAERQPERKTTHRSTMSTKYTITEGPYSLKELASKVKLPQVVLVTQGFCGATDQDTISGGQVMVAFFIKRIKGVTAMHFNRSFHIPLNSAMQFSPLPSEGVLEIYDRVADVIEKEPTPAVVATVNMTRDAYGQMVRPGTILFPNKSKKTLKKKKSIKKKGEAANAEFTTTLGTKVHLPMDCAAGFSTQVRDVKLYLPELMAHLTLPVDVKCFGHQKSRHCNSMSDITLTTVCEETAITGGLTVEGDTICDEQFDLPLDVPVQVACVDLTEEDLQHSLYARVKSTYESVDCRFAMHKKVVINGDESDKAQQEFYSTVRTDIAQDVVTVDVPERIYDEVGFGNAKGPSISNAYESVRHSNGSGSLDPAPPLPPHCHEDSQDEPYVEMLSRVDSEKKEVVALPKPPLVPPKPCLDSHSTSRRTKPHSVAADMNAESTTLQHSTVASSVRTHVPTPPPPPPLHKAATTYQRAIPVPPARSQARNPTSPPLLPPRKSSIDIYDLPSVSLDSTELPTHSPATITMPDSGDPTTVHGVPPQPTAKDKKQRKRMPPPLHSKPLQPVLRSPPPTLPQKQEAIYEEIQPEAFTAGVHTSLVPDRLTQLPPAPAPKPVSFKKAATQPQLQTQAEGSNSGPVDEAGNIDYLKKLTCNDIIRLLEAMDLHQYIDSFMKEHIDGELLACMTDAELQEVGINSSFHRKRFTKVIEGRHSAEQLLECGNPYASVSSHP